MPTVYTMYLCKGASLTSIASYQNHVTRSAKPNKRSSLTLIDARHGTQSVMPILRYGRRAPNGKVKTSHTVFMSQGARMHRRAFQELAYQTEMAQDIRHTIDVGGQSAAVMSLFRLDVCLL
jgi:hypothetical protein